MVKVIGKITRISIEKDGIDDIAILLLIVVIDMNLEIMQFALDDMFGDVVEMEAVGLENLGYSISGEVDFGKIEGSCDVHIRNIIGDLSVVLVL